MNFKSSEGLDTDVTDAESVRSLLASLEGAAYFAILERDPDTYVQAYRDAPDQFQLEVRLGSPVEHYGRTTSVSYPEVERVFVEFFEGRDVMAGATASWTRVVL